MFFIIWLTLKTVRNYLTPLRAIFARAYTKREIKHNPLNDFKPSDIIAGKKSDYEVGPYNLDEIEKLLNMAGAYSNFFQFWEEQAHTEQSLLL